MFKSKDDNSLIIVGGATATGKTSYALKLAKKLDGELINADSRQIYKYLNIGTNKGKLQLRDGQNFIKDIPIYLIDFLDLDRRFSVFDWKVKALEIIEDIKIRGKTPIIVGGTGLYIDSLIKNYSFEYNYQISEDQVLQLQKLDINNLNCVQKYFSENLTKIWSDLNYSDQNNLRRLQRIIQKLTNVSSEEQKTNSVLTNYTFYYPIYDWEDLKLKIDKRVEDMFQEGLIDETKNLIKNGYNTSLPAFQIMGYKEVIQYLNNEITLNKCIELVKIAHKQYARRQRTWFEGNVRNYNLTRALF